MGNFVKSITLLFTLVFMSNCYCQETINNDTTYFQPALNSEIGGKVPASFVAAQHGIFLYIKQEELGRVFLCSFEYKIVRENKIILNHKTYGSDLYPSQGAYFDPEFKNMPSILEKDDSLIFYNFVVYKDNKLYPKVKTIEFEITQAIYKPNEYEILLWEKLSTIKKWDEITSYYSNMCAIDLGLTRSLLGFSKDSTYASIEYGLVHAKEITYYEFRYYIKSKEIKVYSSNTNFECTLEEWEKNLKE